MNGVTGRMGLRQHLQRSILAIRDASGIQAADSTTIVPEPILVGRDERKLRSRAAAHDIARWSMSLDEALAEPDAEIYFDAQITRLREKGVRAAVEAGKAVYCEKPIAEGLSAALDLARLVRDAGVPNGVVQDKLSLPGLRKLKRLVDGGFFGRILSVRGEFGYWVFEGDWQAAQLNSSWALRVYRDELVEFQVDGTEGSAIAGLRDCKVQHRATTPKPVWNPDLPVTEPFRDQWQQVPDNEDFDNGFKVQWEEFLRSVVDGTTFPYDFLAGAKGVQLAELGLKSWQEGRKLEVPELTL